MVGSGQISIVKVTKYRENIDWFPIEWKHKSAGKVQMRTVWTPSKGSHEKQPEESKDSVMIEKQKTIPNQ